MTADLRRSATPIYQPGQKVWLSTRDIRLRTPCKIHWPLFHREADQPGHLPTPATSTLPYTPHFSCVTP